MNSKKEVILAAKEVAEKYSIEIPKPVADGISDLDNPHCRVAVVGRYQVGKSTLVNHVFLEDQPLLAEGRGVATTSVATDIEYGPERKLEVYHWADERHETDILTEEKTTPSVDDIVGATVASDDTERESLAKRISRVVVRVPCETLRDYTVIDTPGLDDPNGEMLANTTYRVIPNSDVALLVVAGKQLGEREKDILHKNLQMDSGVSRILVLVSYRPSSDLDEEERECIVKSIRADLDEMGCENIEVKMYCFDTSVSDILCTAGEIRTALKNWFDENALPGREEKVAGALRSVLESEVLKLVAQIVATQTDEAGRKRLKDETDASAEAFKAEAQIQFAAFQSNIDRIYEEACVKADRAVDSIFDAFLSRLEAQDTVADIQSFLKAEEPALRSQFEDKMSILCMDANSKIQAAVADYGRDLNKAALNINIGGDGISEIHHPIVVKIPPVVIGAANVLLYVCVGPFSWLGGLILQLLGRKLFNPSGFVMKKIICSVMAKELEDSKSQAKANVAESLRDEIDRVVLTVKESSENDVKRQLASINAGFEAGSSSNVDVEALKKEKEELEAAIATL